MRPGSYEEWVRRYDTITPEERAALRAEGAGRDAGPLFSILLPVYNPHLPWLEEAIASVKAQTYSRWELCLADDASTEPGVAAFLEKAAAAEPRIKLVLRSENGHISACSNSALALATGEWCGLLDQDDLLTENALSLVARELQAHPTAGLIYSDEDFLDGAGTRCNPFIKPDWNPELFLGQNYLNHFSVYRTALLRKIGGFREGFEGSQDYDLALRCIELLAPEQVRHIPRILYHWRMVPGSLADTHDAKPYAKDAAQKALRDHVQRCGMAARVEPCPENAESHRVTFAVPNPLPLVSLILHGDGPHDFTSTYRGYPALEIVEVEPSAGSFGERINRAAMTSTGSILVLLARDLEMVDAAWLDQLVGQASRAEVGVVGVRIWSLGGTMCHGGFILGLDGVVGDGHAGLPRGHPGFFNRTLLQRNCAAVSVACLAVRTEVFRELGGFEAKNLRDHFHDVDFCLRASERGLQVVWTPYVNPIAHGASPLPGNNASGDEDYLRQRWATQLRSDPFYSPNLSLESPAFELAFPPRWWTEG